MVELNNVSDKSLIIVAFSIEQMKISGSLNSSPNAFCETTPLNQVKINIKFRILV